MKRGLYLLLLLISACSQSSDLGPNKLDLAILDKQWSECRTQYTITQTQQKLVGNWRLVANGCGECSWSGLRKATDDVRLVFTTQRVQLYRQGQLVAENDFKLIQSASDAIHLETNSNELMAVTLGPIEFCRTVVAFRSDYADGLSHYFERAAN